jgi:hypothetical protein
MPSLEVITIVGVIVLAGLAIVYVKMRSKDKVDDIMNKRRPTSILVTRGDYVEGLEHIAVALSLTDDTFFYENPDLDARFELSRIEEVEYSDELATRSAVPHGCGVLRLRSHGAAFEFIVGPQDCVKWQAALPARSINQAVSKAG